MLTLEGQWFKTIFLQLIISSDFIHCLMTFEMYLCLGSVWGVVETLYKGNNDNEEGGNKHRVKAEGGRSKLGQTTLTGLPGSFRGSWAHLQH